MFNGLSKNLYTCLSLNWELIKLGLFDTLARVTVVSHVKNICSMLRKEERLCKK